MVVKDLVEDMETMLVAVEEEVMVVDIFIIIKDPPSLNNSKNNITKNILLIRIVIITLRIQQRKNIMLLTWLVIQVHHEHTQPMLLTLTKLVGISVHMRASMVRPSNEIVERYIIELLPYLLLTQISESAKSGTC